MRVIHCFIRVLTLYLTMSGPAKPILAVIALMSLKPSSLSTAMTGPTGTCPGRDWARELTMPVIPWIS